MDNTITPTKLRIAELLRERGMTQKQLADQTGISENSLSRLINGVAQIRLETISMICDALSIQPGELFSR